MRGSDRTSPSHKPLHLAVPHKKKPFRNTHVPAFFRTANTGLRCAFAIELPVARTLGILVSLCFAFGKPGSESKDEGFHTLGFG